MEKSLSCHLSVLTLGPMVVLEPDFVEGPPLHQNPEDVVENPLERRVFGKRV